MPGREWGSLRRREGFGSLRSTADRSCVAGGSSRAKRALWRSRFIGCESSLHALYFVAAHYDVENGCSIFRRPEFWDLPE